MHEGVGAVGIGGDRLLIHLALANAADEPAEIVAGGDEQFRQFIEHLPLFRADAIQLVDRAREPPAAKMLPGAIDRGGREVGIVL